MKNELRVLAVASLAMLGVGVACGATLEKELSKPMLPSGSSIMTYTDIFNRLAAVDWAADTLWLQVKDRAEYDARRTQMRARMIEAVGGFPEKTPLNAKTTGTISREGYVVEKVVFESMPGVYVTGNLFLPNNPQFKAPYPVTLITCGHSFNGKAAAVYQRGCVQLVKEGIAAFIYDPIDQGERMQAPDKKLTVCDGHNAIGVRASMLGLSTARFRLWDGIRAIDYVQSRPELDPNRVGYMGQSGGGTMTSLMMAVDPRIKAAAPSCYLTNLRALCAHMGPQDAEQNIFGQLSFGLNHAGYVLLQNLPVSVTCTFNDMFPYYGTRETYAVAEKVLATVGDSEKLSCADACGPHGWKESTRAASVAWMKKWLKGGSGAAYDMREMRRLDIAFNPSKSDMGLAEKESYAAEGDVSKLPGFRSSYHVLRDELKAADEKRVALSPAKTAALVRKLAGIKNPKDLGVKVIELVGSESEGVKVERLAFTYPAGLSLPTVLLLPAEIKAAPALICSDVGRADVLGIVRENLAAGRPTMVATLTGFGEIGDAKYVFYGAKDHNDEGAALMAFLLGESLVGLRATDILLLADYLKTRFGGAIKLVARGKAAIPAAHAFAAERGAFTGVEVAAPVSSWRDVMAGYGRYPFANIVNGALKYYDWPDLLK